MIKCCNNCASYYVKNHTCMCSRHECQLLLSTIHFLYCREFIQTADKFQLAANEIIADHICIEPRHSSTYADTNYKLVAILKKYFGEGL